MNPRRVLLISKNFWPVSGETELLAAAFAKQLSKHVEQVDVITWRMIRQWPGKFHFCNCSVLRLPHSHRTSWSPAALGYYGRNRWHRSLQRWISEEVKHYDAGFVFEFESDALAPTIMLGKTGLPVVSRIHQKLLAGLSRNTSRDIRNLKRGTAVFATPDPNLLLDPLSAVDGPLSGLVCIPDGRPEPPSSAPDRMAAREILGRVHPIFKLNEDALLVVCGADLTFESGVFALVRAWRRVVAEQPDARLWLIGTGRNSPEVFQRVCDLDMQHSVLLTGNFDDVADIMAAADAFIMPGSEPPGWYANVACQFGLTLIHHRDCEVADSTGGARILQFDDDQRSIDLVLSRWAASQRQPEPSSPASYQMAHSSNDSSILIDEMVQRYLALIERQRHPVGN